MCRPLPNTHHVFEQSLHVVKTSEDLEWYFGVGVSRIFVDGSIGKFPLLRVIDRKRCGMPCWYGDRLSYESPAIGGDFILVLVMRGGVLEGEMVIHAASRRASIATRFASSRRPEAVGHPSSPSTSQRLFFFIRSDGSPE